MRENENLTFANRAADADTELVSQPRISFVWQSLPGLILLYVW